MLGQPAALADDVRWRLQMSDSSTVYRSARISIHQAGRSRALLYSREHGHVLEVDASVARLLSLCQGCKTLDGHAAAIARAGVAGDTHAVVATLRSLAMSGLLRSSEDLLPPPSPRGATDVRPITTVAIITANRPQVLARGLGSFVRHLDVHGQAARLLVVDGSSRDDDQAWNRKVVSGLAATSNRQIDYVGPAEAAALRDRLAAADQPRDTLDFALTPGSIGANRNLVLLLTAGEHVLMADDDILCEPWTRGAHANGLSVGGHADPHDAEFFTTRDDVRHAAIPAPLDVLASHGAVLGQALPGLLSASETRPDLSETCGHLIGALVERRAPAVLLTFSGIAGDAGTYCPYARLFASGPTQARMAASRDVFELALRSREVLRLPPQTMLTHDPRCMAGCMGLANRGLVPPFMPVGRNEDGVFGTTVHALDALTIFAHVPVGVVHASDRSAMYEDRTMRSASETRMSDVLMLAIRAATQGEAEVDPAARLAGLAGAFRELGRREPGDFVRHVTRLLIDFRAQQLARIEAMVSRSAEYPPYWRSSLEEYRRAIVRSLARPDFFLPVEFQHAGSVEEGFGDLQRFVGRFGALLEVWPGVYRAAN